MNRVRNNNSRYLLVRWSSSLRSESEVSRSTCPCWSRQRLEYVVKLRKINLSPQQCLWGFGFLPLCVHVCSVFVFLNALEMSFVVSHAALAGNDAAGQAGARFIPYWRETRKQTERVIDCWFVEVAVSDRSSCWQLEGDADDRENKGVGLKRRKEGVQPALFVLARTRAFITPPEIQSKALFTHSVFVRAANLFLCLSFFLPLYLFLCLAQSEPLIYMVFVEFLALTDHSCFLRKREKARPWLSTRPSSPSLYTSFPLSSLLSSKAFFFLNIMK